NWWGEQSGWEAWGNSEVTVAALDRSECAWTTASAASYSHSDIHRQCSAKKVNEAGGGGSGCGLPARSGCASDFGGCPPSDLERLTASGWRHDQPRTPPRVALA